MTGPLWLVNLGAYSFQVAVMVMAGSLILMALRLRVPKFRLLYWQALLGICLVLPGLEPWSPYQAHAADSALAAHSGIIVTFGPAGPDLGAWMQGNLVFVLLLTGLLIRIVWIALGLRKLRRYRQQASRIDTTPQALVEAYRWVSVSPAVYVSAEVRSPATFGLFHPAVLLPKRFFEMPEPLQTAAVCHELLHVARRDWAWHMAEEAVLTVLWFHPAVWWAVRNIRLSREQTVDAEVVRRTAERRPYLQALLEMARQGALRSRFPAPLFLREGQLAARVALMKKEVRMKRSQLIGALMAAVAVLCITGYAAVWCFPLKSAALPLKSSIADTTGSQTSALEPSAAGAPSTTALDEDVGTETANSANDQERRGGPHQVDVKKLKRVYMVQPHYPPLAKQAGIQGTVTLQLVVNGRGEVSDIQVVSGPPELVKASLDAVKEWRYEPGPLLPARTKVEIHFTLEEKAPTAPAKSEGENRAAPAGQRVSELKPAYKVPPIYPPLAKVGGVQGIVTLKVHIKKDGTVSAVNVLSGPQILAQSAIDAVRQWRYAPGPRLPAVTTVTVNYTLADRKQQKPKDAAGDPPIGSGASAMAPQGAAGAVYRVGKDVTAPVKVYGPDPPYTQEGRQAHLNGQVIMAAVIDAKGNVDSVQEISKPLGKGLDESAMKTLRTWKFKPATREGQPVPVKVKIEITFRYY